MNYDNIPKDLKAVAQWVCYRSFLDKESGKYKKVIVSPKTQKFAKSNDPDTWTSFSEAEDFCLKNKYDGLAFVLSSGLVFIDIDRAIDGKGNLISQEARELLAALPDTFTERSLSGTGIHIIFKGSLPKDACKRNDAKGIEMYDTRRFICMTGDLLSKSTRLADYSEIAEEINFRFLGKRPAQPFKRQECSLTDTELIEKISVSRQGAKFRRLYGGDTGGYQSHSNADCALAGILSWWTQDSAQIDRIFRSSALMRGKWDRPVDNSTYGANLIDAMLDRNTYRNKVSPTAIPKNSQM